MGGIAPGTPGRRPSAAKGPGDRPRPHVGIYVFMYVFMYVFNILLYIISYYYILYHIISYIISYIIYYMIYIPIIPIIPCLNLYSPGHTAPGPGQGAGPGALASKGRSPFEAGGVWGRGAPPQ